MSFKTISKKIIYATLGIERILHEKDARLSRLEQELEEYRGNGNVQNAHHSCDEYIATVERLDAEIHSLYAIIQEKCNIIDILQNQANSFSQKLHTVGVYDALPHLYGAAPLSYSHILSRKIVIYGLSQYGNNIELFFDGLCIDSYICDDGSPLQESHNDKKVYTLAAFAKNYDKTQLIIIALQAPDEACKALSELGLVQGKDFITGSELLLTVNEPETFKAATIYANKRVYVYAEDEYHRANLKHMNPSLNVTAWLCNSESEPQCESTGAQAKTLADLACENKDEYVVIIADFPSLRLKNIFLTYNLCFGEHFYFYSNKITSLYDSDSAAFPADLLLKAFTDNKKFASDCDITSRKLKVNEKGEIFACCKFNLLNLGSIANTSIEIILKDAYARMTWLSIANGSYSFCSSKCAMLDNKLIENNYEAFPSKLNAKPINEFLVSLDYDDSCNLTCKSCRNGLHATPMGDKYMLDLVHDEITRSFKELGEITVGNGDFFVSEYYRDFFFKHYEAPELEIITNGILLNESNFDLLSARYKKLSISISIDATNEKTYKLLRGGNFATIEKNLKMLNKKKQSGHNLSLCMNFVVQKENYREMPDFVRLAQSVGADKVAFARILNWGTYSDKDFLLADVYDPNNPLHNDFLLVLRHEALKTTDLNIYIEHIETLI